MKMLKFGMAIYLWKNALATTVTDMTNEPYIWPTDIIKILNLYIILLYTPKDSFWGLFPGNLIYFDNWKKI